MSRRCLTGFFSNFFLGSALTLASLGPAKAGDLNPHDLALLDRLTWGVNASSAEHLRKPGVERWLEEQLHPAELGVV